MVKVRLKIAKMQTMAKNFVARSARKSLEKEWSHYGCEKYTWQYKSYETVLTHKLTLMPPFATSLQLTALLQHVHCHICCRSGGAPRTLLGGASCDRVHHK